MADAPSQPLWYFAYGSNMHRAIFTGRRGMHPLAVRWGWLADYRLAFNLPIGSGERGVANLEAVAGARTCGVLYLLSGDDLERLDRSEGVHLGVYQRLAVEVCAEGEERVAAFAYQSRLVASGRKPSARYLGLLIEGARQHGLPETYVRTLEALERAHDERVSPPRRP